MQMKAENSICKLLMYVHVLCLQHLKSVELKQPMIFLSYQVSSISMFVLLVIVTVYNKY